MTSMPFSSNLRDRLCVAVRRQLIQSKFIDASRVQQAATFEEMGVDSIGMLMIASEFEDRLKTELPAHLLWDCPDIQHFADYLINNVARTNLEVFIDSEQG